MARHGDVSLLPGHLAYELAPDYVAFKTDNRFVNVSHLNGTGRDSSSGVCRGGGEAWGLALRRHCSFCLSDGSHNFIRRQAHFRPGLALRLGLFQLAHFRLKGLGVGGDRSR